MNSLGLSHKLPFRRKFSYLLEERIGQKLNNMQIISGPRQVGKTTGVQQVLDGWSGSKLYETADNQSHDHSWIAGIWNKALSLPEPTILVLDEVQKIPNWSEVIKLHFDQIRGKKDLRIILLGSASNSLEKGYTESLAGRFELIKVPHWTFKESQDFFNWDLDTYLKFGGYPEASKLISDENRWKDYLYNSIITPCLAKDILSFVSIRKPALFRQTFDLAIQYPAMEISLQKLLGQLQDRGNAETIKHYLNLFENAYLLKTLEKFSGSIISQKKSSPKIIPMCPALTNCYSDPKQTDNNLTYRGRIIEATIGAHLSHSTDNLFYWRDGSDEVDYVIAEGKDLFAVEIKSGRKKFTKGMQRFISKYPKAIPVIIGQEKIENLLLEENPLEAIKRGLY